MPDNKIEVKIKIEPRRSASGDSFWAVAEATHQDKPFFCGEHGSTEQDAEDRAVKGLKQQIKEHREHITKTIEINLDKE